MVGQARSETTISTKTKAGQGKVGSQRVPRSQWWGRLLRRSIEVPQEKERMCLSIYFYFAYR